MCYLVKFGISEASIPMGIMDLWCVTQLISALKKARQLVDFVPSDNGPCCCYTNPGYTLVFIVFNYGLPDTFGKDPVVFYHNLYLTFTLKEKVMYFFV